MPVLCWLPTVLPSVRLPATCSAHLLARSPPAPHAPQPPQRASGLRPGPARSQVFPQQSTISLARSRPLATATTASPRLTTISTRNTVSPSAGLEDKAVRRRRLAAAPRWGQQARI